MADLYSDGRHYDALLGELFEDVDYYASAVRGLPGGVLELACGTGRITLPLAAANADVTGLDLNQPMLIRALEKAKAAKVAARFVQGDMRDFDLKRQFARILLPYNSFEHIHDLADAESLLACVRRHLAPGGLFMMDVHQPQLELLSRKPGEIFGVSTLGPAPDGTQVTGEEIRYDNATQVYTIRWHYDSARIDELRLRMYFPKELDALLHYNGFKVIKKYGDYAKAPYGPDSLKQIFVCEAR